MTGAELRALRKSLGLSQQELARALGAQQAHVSQWERGIYKVPRLVARVVSDKEILRRLRRKPP